MDFILIYTLFFSVALILFELKINKSEEKRIERIKGTIFTNVSY